MAQFHGIHKVEFVKGCEDEPVVRYGDREINHSILDDYLFKKFQGWWQLKYPQKKARLNDYYNFIRFHADLVRDYITRHGHEVCT